MGGGTGSCDGEDGYNDGDDQTDDDDGGDDDDNDNSMITFQIQTFTVNVAVDFNALRSRVQSHRSTEKESSRALK